MSYDVMQVKHLLSTEPLRLHVAQAMRPDAVNRASQSRRGDRASKHIPS